MNAEAINKPENPAVEMYAREQKEGGLDRRELLARATSLGVASSVAYGLIGMAVPTKAASHIQRGGILRMQMEVRANCHGPN